MVDRLAEAAAGALLDVHRDRDHNRSVLTLAGPDVEPAARSLAAAAVELLDLRVHAGAHPRMGVVDVVPFVPLAGSTMADAGGARDRFAEWAGRQLGVPCFLYGPGPGAVAGLAAGSVPAARTLPQVRREGFVSLAPDTGPVAPHPTAGAIAVGARPLLVAYNLWLEGGGADTLTLARAVAAEIRGPAVRALGLRIGELVQVSCNLIDPERVGPLEIYRQVAARAPVQRAELVGLAPASVLAAVPRECRARLDLAEGTTIEARLREAGLDGGSNHGGSDPGGS